MAKINGLLQGLNSTCQKSSYNKGPVYRGMGGNVFHTGFCLRLRSHQPCLVQLNWTLEHLPQCERRPWIPNNRSLVRLLVVVSVCYQMNSRTVYFCVNPICTNHRKHTVLHIISLNDSRRCIDYMHWPYWSNLYGRRKKLWYRDIGIMLTKTLADEYYVFLFFFFLISSLCNQVIGVCQHVQTSTQQHKAAGRTRIG